MHASMHTLEHTGRQTDIYTQSFNVADNKQAAQLCMQLTWAMQKYA